MKRLTARVNVHIVLAAVVTSFWPHAAQAACFAETMAVATFGFERIPGDQTARQVYEIRKSQANSALASCERADRDARKLAKDYAAAQAASASAQREVEAEIARAQENAASAASNREDNRALLGVISAMVRDGQCQDAKITALNAGRMDLADQAMRLCVPAPASAAAKPPAVSSVPSRRDTKSAPAAASASQPPVSAASTATLAPERKGNARIQYRLGIVYASGRGVAQDYAAAVSHYRNAAEQGYAAAQYELGMMYLNGTGVPQDDAAAISWFRKAADQGYAVAQDALKNQNASVRGVSQEDAAFTSTLALAKQGRATAQNNLGMMYDNGQGVAQNYVAAVSWYLKAAKQGYASAQYNLGVMYDDGQGVAQDDVTAVSWYRQAAEQGYASAQNNLGLMYSQGQGVAQDYVQAYKWYYLASVWATDAKARDTANKNKNLVAAKMQPAQVGEAQRLASAWRKK